MIYLFGLSGYWAKEVIVMAGGKDLIDEIVVVDNYSEVVNSVGLQRYMQVCLGNGVKIMFEGNAWDEDLKYLKARFGEVAYGFLLKAEEYRDLYKELGYVVGSFEWDVEKFDKIFVRPNWFDVKILRYFAMIGDEKMVVYFDDYRDDGVFEYYPKFDVGVGGLKDYKVEELKNFFEKVRKSRK